QLSHIATQGQMPSASGPILLQKWLLETPPASPPRNQRQTTWQYRCAKWQHANSTSDVEIGDGIESAELPELNIILAGEATRLRFVQVHFDDPRTIFEVTGRNPPSAAGATVPLAADDR
ncbi:hypothetical protein M8037_07230, partial [Sinorhizobium meliloti]|uniref:hypothetical protein n=1 Tax=Rhizobium meliloti TaxID=382 RepID=UPI0020736E82